MVEKLNTDEFGRVIITEEDLVYALYENPTLDYNNVELDNPTKYNNAIKINYSDLYPLPRLAEILFNPEEWHRQNQSHWNMPIEYAQFDIERYVLDQCNGEAELQRAAAELIIYNERNYTDMLRYLKYLVDVMRANNIVWGVGRGSSVASFVLYLIGIHRINSLEYDLDIAEFLR